MFTLTKIESIASTSTVKICALVVGELHPLASVTISGYVPACKLVPDSVCSIPPSSKEKKPSYPKKLIS